MPRLHQALQPRWPVLPQLRVWALDHAQALSTAPVLLELGPVQACMAGFRGRTERCHQQAAVELLQRAGVLAYRPSLPWLPPGLGPQNGGVPMQAAEAQGLLRPSCCH